MIHAMLHMITETDLRLEYQIECANQSKGAARWTADYKFSSRGRRVHNELRSRFTFKDALILKHIDDCDPWKWGMQALGQSSASQHG